MHEGEVEIDAARVQRLLAAQFPQWASLPLRRVVSFGTDNALFRLGDELVVRLPRIGWAVGQVEKELQWLPWLAPQLPLAVPQPLALGQPGEGYGWTWGVYRWLPGDMPQLQEVAADLGIAAQLAGFVLALRAVEHTNAPRGDEPSRALHLLNAPTVAAIAASRELLDAPTLQRISDLWEAAQRLPGWPHEPEWVHGDLHSSNLLLRGGQLSAVLDFSALGLDDPAADLMVAWNAFGAEARQIYREALRPDEATWRRGRAWALSKAMLALPYYQHTNPEIVGRAEFTIREVLRNAQVQEG